MHLRKKKRLLCLQADMEGCTKLENANVFDSRGMACHAPIFIEVW